MNEAGFRSVFEHSNDAILVFDFERDEILAANPRAASLLGYTREELRALSPTAIHPGELDAFAGFVESVQRDGSGWTASLSCVTKSGDSIPAEISATVFEYGDREVVLASVRDVSEREERERLLEDLASTTDSLIRLRDHEAIAEYGVEAAERILGLELSHLYLCEERDDDGTVVLTPAAVTETFRAELGEPPTFERGESLLWDAYAEGTPQFYDDVRTEAGDRMATDLPFRNAMLFPLGEHGVLGIASRERGEFDDVHYDVAEIIASQVKAALDSATHLTELERTNERLDEIVSIASHDLRNPLTVAQGHLELARSDGDDENLGEVASSLERMEALIEDVLVTAQAGGADVDLELVDLASVADACWQHATTPDASIRVTAAETICADPQRIQQLFENLFRNASEHARSDGESVTVTVGALDEREGFYVADDGVGIPEGERDRIFEHGYTGDDGTGLGLNIVAQVATAHDWRITVTESESGGARFEFTSVETRTAEHPG